MEEKARLRLKETEQSKQYDESENNEDVPIEPYRTICEYCGRSIVTCTKKEYNCANTICDQNVIIMKEHSDKDCIRKKFIVL